MVTPLAIGFNGRFFANNWRPAREEIEFAARHSFQALQFQGKETGLDGTHLGADLPSVAHALRDAGLTAVMEMVIRVGRDGKMGEGEGRGGKKREEGGRERKRGEGGTPLEVLVANLPAITQLPCVCVHWHLVLTDALPPGEVEAFEAALVPQLAEAVDLADQHGFRFGLEHNEPTIAPFSTPAAGARALAAVPGLGLVWDVNHTHPDDLAAFEALIPRVSMVHLSDTRLPEVNEHLPVGLGNIDFAARLRALRQNEFRGVGILEIGGLPKSGGYGRDTDAALIESLARLQKANLQEKRQD